MILNRGIAVAARRCAAGMLLGLVAGCGTNAPKAVEPPPPEVTVAAPLEQEVTDFLEYTGRTESPQVVQVRARVSGYLTKVHFSDGQEVKEGEPLFEIDERPFVNSVASAEGQLAEAEARLKTTTAELARTEDLVKKGASTQRDLDIDVGSKAQAVAAIQTRQASVAQAKLDLEFSKIIAPISGRLSKTNATIGNLISPGQIGGEPLTTIVSMDPMHVYLDVDEGAVLKFRDLRRKQGYDLKFTYVRELNQPVFIGLSSDEGCPHEGVLDFVDNAVNTATGTLRVRAELPNPKREFAPGFFVRVRLPFGKPRPALLVPDRAIGTDQSLKFVLVVNDQDVVERRDVKLGMPTNGLRVIESGLKSDDAVIVNGIQRARPGAKVKPQRHQNGDKKQ